MKILVTGGAGFIGANFVYYMMKAHPDYELVVYDLLTYAGNLETLEDALKNPKVKFIKGDIADRQAVFEMFEQEKFDIVVNFAAESHVDRSIENPGIFLVSNIIGTQTLLDACRKYGIQRYHQVSTDEVYGDLPLDRPDLFFTETTLLQRLHRIPHQKHRRIFLPLLITELSECLYPYPDVPITTDRIIFPRN